MASQMDVHTFTANLGAFNGATEVPLVKLPSTGGDITILEAYLVGPSAGTTIGGLLVSMSNVGTPAINGTVGSFAGTCVTAAGVTFALTISNQNVTGGNWLGFDQTSGTVPAGTFIVGSYVMGKGA